MESKTKYARFRYTQEQLEAAIDDIQFGNMTQNAASIKYGIPKATLNNKIRGSVPMERKMGPQTILSDNEEKKLENWILAKAKLGFPMHHEEIQLAVQSIFKASKRVNPFTNNKPGKKWLKLFLRRRPAIVQRNAEIISKARASVTKDSIRSWFNDLRKYNTEGGFEDVINDPTRSFNADETGMQFCPKMGKLLGPKNYKNFYTIAAGPEKECMTVLCNFSAAGMSVQPMLTVPYKRVPRDVASSVPDGYFLGRSESRWMVSETFYEYIANCFYPWLQQNNIQLPVLLFLDGHKSHINMNLFEFCKEKSIPLYCLPPNATHIIQPCDVSIFKPLKAAWRRTIEECKQTTHKYITKATFAPLFQKAFETSISEDSIKNGFRCCGLYPLNPDSVNYDKTISARRSQLSVQEANEGVDPNTYDFQATLRVIEQFFQDQCNDEKSDINKLHTLCKNKIKNINTKDNLRLTESMIDAMPVQFDDMTFILDNVETESLNNLEAKNYFLDVEPQGMKPERMTTADNKTDSNLMLEPNENHDEINLNKPKEIFSETVKNMLLGNKCNHSQNVHEQLCETTSYFTKAIENEQSEENDNFQIHYALDELPEIAHTLDVLPKINSGIFNNNSTNEVTKTVCDIVSDCDYRTEPSKDKNKQIVVLSNKILREGSNQSQSDFTRTGQLNEMEDIWKTHLHWPEIPGQSGGRDNKKVKDKMPFALISKEWKEFYDRKERNKCTKLEEAKQKREDRKRKAEEKKNQKQQYKKRTKKNKENETKKPLDSANENEGLECPDTEKIVEFQIGDFVIVKYDMEYFPGQIKAIDKEEYGVTTMSNSKGGELWKWPIQPDIIWYKKEDMVKKIPPPRKIIPGGFYKITAMCLKNI